MLPASELNRLPTFWVHPVTLGRPYAILTCDLCSCCCIVLWLDAFCVCSEQPVPGASSEGNVGPALPLARKRNMKMARPQGRARAAVPRKATRRIDRVKATVIPTTITSLLRKAAANINVLSRADVHSRANAPEQSGALLYGCEFASSEQPPGFPPLRMHTRNSQGST